MAQQNKKLAKEKLSENKKRFSALAKAAEGLNDIAYKKEIEKIAKKSASWKNQNGTN